MVITISTMPKVIGFDFGTSYSSVATSMQCRPQVILSRFKDRSTPSVVAVQDGRITVGEEGPWQRTGAVPSLKRIIGLSYDDKMVEKYMNDTQIKLENIDGVVWLPVFREQEVREELRVEEFVSLLFHELTLHMHPIDRAVITVPASFGNIQRRAIKDAGAIAKFREVELIEETTAAAVAFSFTKDSSQVDKDTTLIFQLGGGTIDVAIFNITKSSITVLGNACSSSLGGIDFDRNLLEYTLEKAGTSVDDAERMILIKSCKEAKEKLGKTNRAEIIHQSPNFNIQISRQEFEIANQDLLSIIDIMIDTAMEAANVKEVDEYIVIGRGCLIPYVEKNIARKLGKHKRSYDVDIKEAAVMGAAIYAETGSKNIHIHDQRSGTISININDGIVFHGVEAERLFVESLPALHRVNTKGLNMEITVGALSGDTPGSSQSNSDSPCRSATPVWGEKRIKIDESIRKVSSIIGKNKENMKIDGRVERLYGKATNLLRDSENEIRKYEAVKLVSEDTVKWIKHHEGPFEKEELDHREKKLSEKTRLIEKKEPAGIWGCITACFISIFYCIRGFFRRLLCFERGGAPVSDEPKYDQMNEPVEEYGTRVVESTENQENEKNETVKRNPPGQPTTSG